MKNILLGILTLITMLTLPGFSQTLPAQPGAGGGLLDQLEQDGLGAGGFGDGGFGDSIFGSDNPVTVSLKKAEGLAPGPDPGQLQWPP